MVDQSVFQTVGPGNRLSIGGMYDGRWSATRMAALRFTP